MLEFLRKHKNKIILPLSLLIYGIIFTLNNTDIYFSAVTIFSPAEKIINEIIKDMKEYWYGYIYLVNTENDNLILRKKLRDSGKLKYSFEELKRENKSLKEFLSFKEKTGIKSSGASVIFRGALSESDTVFINRGTEDGIAKNMVAILPEGIVGKVVKVSKSLSMVYLITHPNSSVDAIIQRTRDRCVFHGGKPCKLNYLNYNADVKSGDIVLSSGLGGVFPGNFPLGKIVRVQKDSSGFFLNADVVPIADLSHLEEVLILENPYHLEIEQLKKSSEQ